MEPTITLPNFAKIFAEINSGRKVSIKKVIFNNPATIVL